MGASQSHQAQPHSGMWILNSHKLPKQSHVNTSALPKPSRESPTAPHAGADPAGLLPLPDEPAACSQLEAGLGGQQQSQTEPAVGTRLCFHSSGVTRQQMGEFTGSCQHHKHGGSKCSNRGSHPCADKQHPQNHSQGILCLPTSAPCQPDSLLQRGMGLEPPLPMEREEI